MTRSNLHIKLSNGKSLICVADSSSAPEQGYIVERLFLPCYRLITASRNSQCLKSIARWMKGVQTQIIAI